MKVWCVQTGTRARALGWRPTGERLRLTQAQGGQSEVESHPLRSFSRRAPATNQCALFSQWQAPLHRKPGPMVVTRRTIPAADWSDINGRVIVSGTKENEKND